MAIRDMLAHILARLPSTGMCFWQEKMCVMSTPYEGIREFNPIFYANMCDEIAYLTKTRGTVLPGC